MEGVIEMNLLETIHNCGGCRNSHVIRNLCHHSIGLVISYGIVQDVRHFISFKSSSRLTFIMDPVIREAVASKLNTFRDDVLKELLK
jgi:hypothetical protein